MGDKKKILVVDDEEQNVKLLSSLLKAEGYETEAASNGREAVEKVKLSPPDLVLMDIMMPDMDGYQAIRRIRDMDAFGDLPIVALTAKAMRGDREESLAAGASDYVTKPVEIDQLLDTLRVWLHR